MLFRSNGVVGMVDVVMQLMAAVGAVQQTAPIPKLTDREKGCKLERKGAQGNGNKKGKKGDCAAAVR